MGNSAERYMVQNMTRNKMKARESLDMLSNTYGVIDNSTSLERDLGDTLQIYQLMMEKGFNLLPEETSEKRAFRQLESKLKTFKLIDKVAPKVDTPKMPVEEIKESKKKASRRRNGR